MGALPVGSSGMAAFWNQRGADVQRRRYNLRSRHRSLGSKCLLYNCTRRGSDSLFAGAHTQALAVVMG